ncbi:hypothetical protein ElyMa_003288400 [Elysia marginata]|uniref:Uncharacterized protein n=1 Tax=Elysia marginata TaxID=1093978 RepID=A0AAV4J9B8_9GAST|nr:hypothetical protein ElyMa_003288400 [Elysia marginata]
MLDRRTKETRAENHASLPAPSTNNGDTHSKSAGDNHGGDDTDWQQQDQWELQQQQQQQQQQFDFNPNDPFKTEFQEEIQLYVDQLEQELNEEAQRRDSSGMQDEERLHHFKTRLAKIRQMVQQEVKTTCEIYKRVHYYQQESKHLIHVAKLDLLALRDREKTAATDQQLENIQNVKNIVDLEQRMLTVLRKQVCQIRSWNHDTTNPAPGM